MILIQWTGIQAAQSRSQTLKVKSSFKLEVKIKSRSQGMDLETHAQGFVIKNKMDRMCQMLS